MSTHDTLILLSVILAAVVIAVLAVALIVVQRGLRATATDLPWFRRQTERSAIANSTARPIWSQRR